MCRRCRRLGGEGGADDAGVFDCVCCLGCIAKGHFFVMIPWRGAVLTTVQQLQGGVLLSTYKVVCAGAT